MDPSRFLCRDDGRTVVAVSIQRVPDSPFNTHTGVVYRNPDDGQLFHLHLAWHNIRIRNSVFRDGLFFAVPDIPEERRRFIPRLCRRIADNPQRLTYALRYPQNARFVIDTGELVTDGNGLNCATFVLTLFAAYGIDLVQIGTWPLRPQDREWHVRLVAMIRADDPPHADRLESEIGRQRARPEEVAGAALYQFDEYPVEFEAAQLAASWIVPIIGRLDLAPSECSCL